MGKKDKPFVAQTFTCRCGEVFFSASDLSSHVFSAHPITEKRK